MTEEEILLAQFAASVSKSLKDVDSKMTGHTASGPANKINPQRFIKQPQAQRAPGHTPNQIRGLDMIEAPKSRPLGADVQGTVAVNPAELMIPMDGLDEETRKAVMAHQQNTPMPVPMPVPMPTTNQPLPPTPHQMPTQIDLDIPSSKDLEKALELIKKMEKEAKSKKPKRGEPAWDLEQSRKAFNYIKRKMGELEKKIDAVLEKKCGCERPEGIGPM